MPHPIFGLTHMMWLTGIVGTAIVLSVICRRKLVPNQYVRGALICLLAGGELTRFLTANIRFPNTLPLNLCNVATWVAVVACLTLSPLAVEFVYFAGFSGAGMALFTPDLGSDWPTQFFLNHGAIVVTASALVYGRLSPLRRGAIWRASGFFALYIGLMALFDWKYRVNYAYLRRKPGTETLLSFLGPWPYYLVAAAAVALFLFFLLWLPARPRGAVEARRPKEQGAASIALAEHS